MNTFIEKLKELLVGKAQRERRQQRPPGCGGYRYLRVRDVLLDARQKAGVRLYYAELIERNKYALAWKTRGKHLR
jgi:hypothetical protein